MLPDTWIREQDRLAALKRYAILDTPAEEAFDRVTRLACRLFAVPMSTVTLIDAHRQWFKAKQGMEDCATPRGPALCDVSIRHSGPMVVSDTHADLRFRDNPFVTGGPRLRFYAGMALRTVDGHAIGTFCVMDRQPRRFDADDIATLKDLAGIVMSELELRRLAMTDALTGVLSRRAFLDQVMSNVAEARRRTQPLALVTFDLDHFKSINDRHGHPVGDRVLVATAEACRRSLQDGVILGRMGGEEFAVLFPNTDLDEAARRAESLRAALMQVRVATLESSIGITASFGVAGLDASTRDVDALLQRADAALYAAKRGGRNRCAISAQDETDEAGIRSGSAGASSTARSLAFMSATTRRESATRAG